MVREFENKNEWAIIVGGSSGLGLASAKKLAKHGMNICIIHRDSRSSLAKIEEDFTVIKNEGVKFIAFNTDGTQEDKIQQTLDSLIATFSSADKVKVLVHSIAKGNLKPMQSEDQNILKQDDFNLTIHAMATSLYTWVTNIFKRELFTKDSRVLSFTSEGNTKTWNNYAAVSAAKAALEAITRNIALEFAPFGIKANCIQAGITETNSFSMIPGSSILKKNALQRNPFKKLTQPEDVANVVYLMCKDEASWINGTIIKVDGGESLQ